MKISLDDIYNRREYLTNQIFDEPIKVSSGSIPNLKIFLTNSNKRTTLDFIIQSKNLCIRSNL